MRILIAGATGAIGRRLVPMLASRGHDVIGTTRTADKLDLLHDLGAQGVVLDALDPAQVTRAITDAKPDVVIHQLTAIGDSPNFRDLDATFAATNRLRTQGTDNLLSAAQAAGVRRFVAQSFAGWNLGHTGSAIKTEDDPLESQAPPRGGQSLAALKHVESTVLGAPLEGVVLRYGGFYGPGNALGAGGVVLRMVHKRQLPVVGGGAGIWSFVHIDDAAAATVIAAEGGPTGLFNITDDEPAPEREWLPYLASTIGAKPPLRLPAWLLRPVLGPLGVAMMTTMRGASNAKARREMNWTPTYASWRQGFREGLG